MQYLKYGVAYNYIFKKKVLCHILSERKYFAIRPVFINPGLSPIWTYMHFSFILFKLHAVYYLYINIVVATA